MARRLCAFLVVSLAPFAALGAPDLHCPSGTAPKTSTRFPGETIIDCVDASGHKAGPTMAFLASGQVTQRGHYKHDHREGRWEFLDRKGKVYLSITFANGDAQSAEWTWRNEREACKTGKPFPDIPVNNSPGMTISCYVLQRGDRVFTGPAREWHLDGSPKCEGAFQRGVPHGPLTCWWPSGAESVKGMLDEGVRVGRWVWHRTDGAVARDQQFDKQGETVRVTGDRSWEPNL